MQANCNSGRSKSYLSHSPVTELKKKITVFWQAAAGAVNNFILVTKLCGELQFARWLIMNELSGMVTDSSWTAFLTTMEEQLGGQSFAVMGKQLLNSSYSKCFITISICIF